MANKQSAVWNVLRVPEKNCLRDGPGEGTCRALVHHVVNLN